MHIYGVFLSKKPDEKSISVAFQADLMHVYSYNVTTCPTNTVSTNTKEVFLLKIPVRLCKKYLCTQGSTNPTKLYYRYQLYQYPVVAGYFWRKGKFSKM